MAFTSIRADITHSDAVDYRLKSETYNPSWAREGWLSRDLKECETWYSTVEYGMDGTMAKSATFSEIVQIVGQLPSPTVPEDVSTQSCYLLEASMNSSFPLYHFVTAKKIGLVNGSMAFLDPPNFQSMKLWYSTSSRVLHHTVDSKISTQSVRVVTVSNVLSMESGGRWYFGVFSGIEDICASTDLGTSCCQVFALYGGTQVIKFTDSKTMGRLVKHNNITGVRTTFVTADTKIPLIQGDDSLSMLVEARKGYIHWHTNYNGNDLRLTRWYVSGKRILELFWPGQLFLLVNGQLVAFLLLSFWFSNKIQNSSSLTTPTTQTIYYGQTINERYLAWVDFYSRAVRSAVAYVILAQKIAMLIPATRMADRLLLLLESEGQALPLIWLLVVILVVEVQTTCFMFYKVLETKVFGVIVWHESSYWVYTPVLVLKSCRTIIIMLWGSSLALLSPSNSHSMFLPAGGTADPLTLAITPALETDSIILHLFLWTLVEIVLMELVFALARQTLFRSDPVVKRPLNIFETKCVGDTPSCILGILGSNKLYLDIYRVVDGDFIVMKTPPEIIVALGFVMAHKTSGKRIASQFEHERLFMRNRDLIPAFALMILPRGVLKKIDLSIMLWRLTSSDIADSKPLHAWLGSISDDKSRFRFRNMMCQS